MRSSSKYVCLSPPKADTCGLQKAVTVVLPRGCGTYPPTGKLGGAFGSAVKWCSAVAPRKMYS